MPKWQRIGLRILGIGLLLLGLWFYVRGFYAFGTGDVDVGSNYRGVRMVSNRDSRIALILVIAGVAVFANSFSGGKDEKDDKDSS